MSNFFTDGRLALIAALQGDAQIDARVKTCFDYGPGLARRHALEPALCPVLSVAPAQGVHRSVANVQREIPQVLHVEVATAGQDVAPCEELAALVAACVDTCNDDCLGLSADGLTALRVRNIWWDARPRQDAVRIIWVAVLEVELLWRRA